MRTLMAKEKINLMMIKYLLVEDCIYIYMARINVEKESFTGWLKNEMSVRSAVNISSH